MCSIEVRQLHKIADYMLEDYHCRVSYTILSPSLFNTCISCGFAGHKQTICSILDMLASNTEIRKLKISTE